MLFPFQGATAGVEGTSYVPKPPVVLTVRPQVNIGKHELDPLFQKYFGANWQRAKAIAWCESRLNPLAENKASQSYGLLQVRIAGKLAQGRPNRETLLQAEPNIAFAAKMSNHGTNWRPWAQCL